jgi:hypothetical protein
MTTPIRLAPSGPDVVNDGGGPFAPGAGAALRVLQFSSVIGDGSVALTTLSADGALGLAGFSTGAGALALSFSNPDPNLFYRAEFQCDLENTDTSQINDATFIIETSVDEGVTWSKRISNVHSIGPSGAPSLAPATGHATLHMARTPGSNLGVVDATLSLRMRVRLCCALAPRIQILSAATPAPNDDVPSAGTAFWKFEEVF